MSSARADPDGIDQPLSSLADHALVAVFAAWLWMVFGGQPSLRTGLLGLRTGSVITTTPGIAQAPFWRAFFFSVETISTIGYGNVVPAGLPPTLVVALRRSPAWLGFAIVTGLLFARISRPTANVLFSSHAVVAPYQNITALGISRRQCSLERVDRSLGQGHRQPL